MTENLTPKTDPAQVSIWRKIWAFRYLHFVVLFVVTSAMDGLSFIPIGIMPGIYAAQHHLDRHSTTVMKGVMQSYAYSWSGALMLTLALLVLSVLLCWLYTLLSRAFERRTVTEYNLTHWAQRLGIGALVGMALLSCSILIVDALGDGKTVWNPHLVIVGMFFAPVICAPIFEELVFRGVWLRIVENMYGSGVALATSSLFFGLAHLANPHSGWLPAIGIAIEAGLMLGMAYVATRSLWLPMGLHFGWNFAEGDIFGAPDSGNTIAGFFQTTTHGDPLITGGAFGPEASLITPALCLIVVAILYRQAVQRGNWVPLRAQHFAPEIWDRAA